MSQIKITIRSFDIQKDVDFFEKMYNDNDSMRFIPLKKELWTKEELINRFATSPPNKRLFVVVDTIANTVIGEAGIYDYENESEVYELGYILHKDYWKKGFGKALCKFLIEKVFTEYKGKRVVCRIDAKNIGSIKTSEYNKMILQKSEIVKDNIHLLTYIIDRNK